MTAAVAAAGFTSKEVAQLCGLAESRVRYWAQTGFVGPSERRGPRALYSFQDLVGVRAAKELLERGVTVQRVRKNLEALKAQLPHVDRPLAQLRILSDGERLLVTDQATTFEPVSGQLVMDFALDALEADVRELERPVERQPRLPGEETAYAWFLDGVQHEAAGADDEALIAYQKALEGDPLLAASHTNLGNLLYRRGDHGDARRHYEQALALDPEQPEARYNLANLHDEEGRAEAAIAEWYRVVNACPEFADAHFNLALALLRDGATARAHGHLRAYLALDGAGEWADRARTLLGV